jgi:steroid delta-isomerase-like uncharacterized protein
MTALTDLTDRILDAYNRADIDAIGDCYAPDAVQVHPFFPGGNHGRDAIRAAERPMFTAFSDIDWELERTIEQGDWGVVESVVSATHTAALPTPDGASVPATNRRITLPLVNVVRLDHDGLIAEEHRYLDVAGMLGQLGLLG